MIASYQTVVSRIQQLSNEQHAIYRRGAHRGLSDNQQRRLREIKTELQQLWLERKRARSRFYDLLDFFSTERK